MVAHEASSEIDDWRWYWLNGEARVQPGEIHYPGCSLHRTREQMFAETLKVWQA